MRPVLTPVLTLVLALSAVALPSLFTGCARADAAPTVHVYKTPTCGCCVAWVEHLRSEGFTVEVEDLPNLGETKRRLGVPADLASCHTATVGGLVVEGHVPAREVRRLLAERPAGVTGLAVPGMPIGSPGMEVPGRPADAYTVLAFGPTGEAAPFAEY